MPAASPDSRAVRAPRSGGAAAPLELLGVAKAFGPRLLFKGVNLRVEPGEVSLLVGPNGAGKSTLMRIMAGLSRPDAGRVNCALEPEQVGYLGHATFIYPGLSARENLAFWLKAAGLSRAAPARNAPGADASRAGKAGSARSAADVRGGTNAGDTADAVDEALSLVGLGRHAHERAGIFSRGMAQRLNLARLLLFRPRLLLLDEPGTGLDLASRTLLRDVVRDARASGASVVWISHDQAEDARLADRVLRLENRTLTDAGRNKAAREHGADPGVEDGAC